MIWDIKQSEKSDLRLGAKMKGKMFPKKNNANERNQAQSSVWRTIGKGKQSHLPHNVFVYSIVNYI